MPIDSAKRALNAIVDAAWEAAAEHPQMTYELEADR
jgi:hypothetical protein